MLDIIYLRLRTIQAGNILAPMVLVLLSWVHAGVCVFEVEMKCNLKTDSYYISARAPSGEAIPYFSICIAMILISSLFAYVAEPHDVGIVNTMLRSRRDL